MPLSFAARGPMVIRSVFVGPGDIISNAAFWYGLQAYSASYAAAQGSALNLKNSSNTAYSGNPIKFLTSGLLDTTAAATAIAGGFSEVSTLFDHTGNVRDVTDIDIAARPTLSLTAGPGSTPGLIWVSGKNLRSTGNFVQAQPLTMSGVANCTGGTSPILSEFGGTGGTDAELGFATTQVYITSAGAVTPDIVIGTSTWFAANGVLKGAVNTIIRANGSSTTGDGQTAGYNNKIAVGLNNNGAMFSGTICECGCWASDQETNLAALETNQRTRWNF